MCSPSMMISIMPEYAKGVVDGDLTEVNLRAKFDRFESYYGADAVKSMNDALTRELHEERGRRIKTELDDKRAAVIERVVERADEDWDLEITGYPNLEVLV